MVNTIQRTQCGKCKKFFVGVSSFDDHRTGDIGKKERRCKTTEEMLASGLVSEKRQVRILVEGITHLEEHDVWFDPVSRESITNAYASQE